MSCFTFIIHKCGKSVVKCIFKVHKYYIKDNILCISLYLTVITITKHYWSSKADILNQGSLETWGFSRGYYSFLDNLCISDKLPLIPVIFSVILLITNVRSILRTHHRCTQALHWSSMLGSHSQELSRGSLSSGLLTSHFMVHAKVQGQHHLTEPAAWYLL